MKFQNSQKIRTNLPASKVLDLIEEQFQKVSESIERTRNEVVSKSIEASFGSINRSDETVISLKKKASGFTLVSETDYKPSLAFWILLIITLFTWVGWLIPIAFYLVQKTTVKNAIDDVFRRIVDELEDEPTERHKLLSVQEEKWVDGYETDDSAYVPEATMDPLDQIEKLAKLKASGALTEAEFNFKKAELLGMPVEKATNSSPSSVGEYYIRRDEKVMGPYSIGKLRKSEMAGHIRGSDELGESRDGPWQDALAKLRSDL